MKRKSDLIEEIINYNYKKFTTGLNFTDVRRQLAQEQKQRAYHNDYMFVTRKTVLGRWYQIKKQMFQTTEIEKYIRGMSYKKLLITYKKII